MPGYKTVFFMEMRREILVEVDKKAESCVI